MGVTQYSQYDRDRMQNDAQVRAAEMREAMDDCTTKIRTQLSADASRLEDDVIKGLASTNQLINQLILSGEEFSEESSEESGPEYGIVLECAMPTRRKYPSAGFNFSRRPRTPPPIPAPTAVATPSISSLKISQNENITS